MALARALACALTAGAALAIPNMGMQRAVSLDLSTDVHSDFHAMAVATPALRVALQEAGQRVFGSDGVEVEVQLDASHRRMQTVSGIVFSFKYKCGAISDCDTLTSQISALTTDVHAQTLIDAINGVAADSGYSGAAVTQSASQVAAGISAPALVNIDLDAVTMAPAPPPSAGGVDSSVTVLIDPAFAAALHPTAFDDCFLTPEEMSTSPAAMAFAAAFRESTAASLGISPDAVQLNGLSTDGDDIPGCADGGGAGVTSGSTITVSPEFAASLHATAFDDCYLTPEEMATSPAAMAFAAAFRESTAASLGVSPDAIILSGISTDGDDAPGCGGGTPLFPFRWFSTSCHPPDPLGRSCLSR